MTRMQQMAEEFRRKMGQLVGSLEYPLVRDATMCARLVEEEAAETSRALRAGDLVEAVDGMCDLLYVTFGAAAAAGVDLEPFYAEVHRTNMLKAGGPVRADGKRLKPPGWEPPRIREMLEELRRGDPGCAGDLCSGCHECEPEPEGDDV